MQDEEERGIAGGFWQTRSVRVALAVTAASLAVFLAAFPLWASNYWIRIATSILMFAVLSEAFNIITGFTGYPAFGNTAFLGLGAYTVAITVDKGLWYPLGILAAGLVALTVCAAVGAPILRLRGHYFAIATLGFAVATREILTNLRSITHGGMGYPLPILERDPRIAGATWYYWMLAIFVACFLSAWWISRSRFGYALRSIKAAEWEAASFGINTTLYKLAAWILSAFYTGLVGGVWALWIAYIDPSSAFQASWGVKFSIMAILGGVGTVLGPVLGAVIVETLMQIVWGTFLEYHLGVLGLAVIIIILFFPGGLMGIPSRLSKKRRKGMAVMPVSNMEE
jgi:branched-chain amino acid transport system permease protein